MEHDKKKREREGKEGALEPKKGWEGLRSQPLIIVSLTASVHFIQTKNKKNKKD